MVQWLKFLSYPEKLPSPHDGPIGVVAGQGGLPLRVIQRLKSLAYTVVVIAVLPQDNALESISDIYESVDLTQGRHALRTCKQNNVKSLFLAGKIPKTQMHHKNYKPDEIVQKIVGESAGHKGDDQLMKRVSLFLRTQGIRVYSLGLVLSEDIAPEGVMTEKKPNQKEIQDLNLGFYIAKAIGKLDIGQAVVVNDGSVVSVEAIEGTNKAIERVGSMALEGSVIIKVAKPQQDIRFDMPVIGKHTLIIAQGAKCSAIGVEVGKCLILDKAEVIKEANAMGIAIVGMKR